MERAAVDGLVELTGWAGERRAVDWAAVERGFGLRLPPDYRALVETFGAGSFDDNLHLRAPGSPDLDLRLLTGEPYGGTEVGLLQWGTTTAEHSFCWLPEGEDPARWPIVARGDTEDPWERFDGTAAEFLYAMLTDPYHPYSLAEYFAEHWFTPYA